MAKKKIVISKEKMRREHRKGYRDGLSGRDPEPASKEYVDGYVHGKELGKLRKPAHDPFWFERHK